LGREGEKNLMAKTKKGNFRFPICGVHRPIFEPFFGRFGEVGECVVIKK